MSKTGTRLLMLLLLLVLAAATVVATHALFTSRFPGANDFYSRWGGARAFWTQGLSPYSDEASAQIEIGIYGRRALPDEDPGPFAYPFYTVFIIAPLAFLPYEWAEAVWLTVLLFSLVGGVIGAMRLAGWRPGPPLLALTLLWAVLFYPSARAILLGQFAVPIFALTVGVLLALKARRDLLAGALLALTTIKPQMVFLIVPFIVMWAVARRRWRIVIGAGAAMLLLAGVSFVLEPAWLRDFVNQMLRYPSYTAIGSPVWIMTRYYLPALGAPGEIVLSLAFLAWALAMWARALRRPDWSVFFWTAGVTLIVTNLIALRTATTNYVILFIPLLHTLATAGRRWPRRGAWAIAGIEIALLVGLWALFLLTVVGKFEHPSVYLPLPLGLALVLAGWRRPLEQGAPT
jgi:hypothetical protein